MIFDVCIFYLFAIIAQRYVVLYVVFCFFSAGVYFYVCYETVEPSLNDIA